MNENDKYRQFMHHSQRFLRAQLRCKLQQRRQMKGCNMGIQNNLQILINAYLLLSARVRSRL
jgi:hypothetical protein